MHFNVVFNKNLNLNTVHRTRMRIESFRCLFAFLILFPLHYAKCHFSDADCVRHARVHNACTFPTEFFTRFFPSLQNFCHRLLSYFIDEIYRVRPVMRSLFRRDALFEKLGSCTPSLETIYPGPEGRVKENCTTIKLLHGRSYSRKNKNKFKFKINKFWAKPPCVI